MARLPQVNGDNDQWGSILNDFLSQSLNTDGTLKTAAVGAGLPAAAVTGSSHYDLGKDTAANMAIGSAWSSINATAGNASNNTALGLNALANLTVGGYNTAIGASALRSFTHGTPDGLGEGGLGENVAVGEGALTSYLTGQWCTAVGRGALGASLTDPSNTAVGWATMPLLTSADGTATENVAVGSEAMNNASYAKYTTAVGHAALGNSGGGTGVPMGDGNTGIGHQALFNTTSGSNNTALGRGSLISVTTSTENLGLGSSAGSNIISGSYNVAIGSGAGPSANDPSFTLCIGRNTSVTQWGAVAIGTDSGGHSASATSVDQFVLGTVQHSVQIPGWLMPQQAVTASAPAYRKGALYFDTTLNKLRVGGATAWETVTSA